MEKKALHHLNHQIGAQLHVFEILERSTISSLGQGLKLCIAEGQVNGWKKRLVNLSSCGLLL